MSDVDELTRVLIDADWMAYVDGLPKGTPLDEALQSTRRAWAADFYSPVIQAWGHHVDEQSRLVSERDALRERCEALEAERYRLRTLGHTLVLHLVSYIRRNRSDSGFEANAEESIAAWYAAMGEHPELRAALAAHEPQEPQP